MARFQTLLFGFALLITVSVAVETSKEDDKINETPAKLLPFKERIRHIQARLDQMKNGVKESNETKHHHHHHKHHNHENKTENSHHNGKRKLSENVMNEKPLSDQPITEKSTIKTGKKLTRSATGNAVEKRQSQQIGPFVLKDFGEEMKIVPSWNTAGDLVYVIPERKFSFQINGADLMASAKETKKETIEFDITADSDGTPKVNVDIEDQRNDRFLDLESELEPIILYKYNPSNRIARYARPYPIQNLLYPKSQRDSSNYFPLTQQNPIF